MESSANMSKTSIIKKWWFWVIIGVVAIGLLAAVITTSVNSIANEQAAALAAAEPFELDAKLEDNGLTVFYPSLWNSKVNETKESIVYIYPPAGGGVMVDSQVATNTGISKDSADLEADERFGQFYTGLVEGSTMTILISDERTRSIEGDALVERTAVTGVYEGADFEGYLYVGFVDGSMAYALAFSPTDAGDGYHTTIKNIIDAVEYKSLPLSPH